MASTPKAGRSLMPSHRGRGMPAFSLSERRSPSRRPPSPTTRRPSRRRPGDPSTSATAAVRRFRSSGRRSGPNGLAVLAQNGAPTADARRTRGPSGQPAWTDHRARPEPRPRRAPGAGPGTARTSTCSTTPTALRPVTWCPSAPGKCEQFDVAPGQENADVSRAGVAGPLHRHVPRRHAQGRPAGPGAAGSNSASRCRAPRRRRAPTFRRAWASSAGPATRLPTVHHRRRHHHAARTVPRSDRAKRGCIPDGYTRGGCGLLCLHHRLCRHTKAELLAALAQ